MNGLWLFLLFIAAILVAAILGLFAGGGLWALAAKLLICLALAAILGAIAGWLLKSLNCGGGEWKAKFEDLEAKFGLKNRELDGLKAELRAGKGELDKTNLRFAEIESERDKHKTAFFDLEARFKDLKSDFDAEQSGRLELDSELIARTKSIANLGMQLNAKDQEIASFVTKLAADDGSKAKIIELEKQLKLSEDKLSSLSNADKESSARLASFEAELETGRNTISTLESQVSEKERRIAALEADLSKAKTDSGNQIDLSGQINSLRQESATKDNRVVELESELNKLRASAGKVNEYESQLNKYKLELSNCESGLKELKSELKSVDSGRTDLDLELAARSKSIADFGLKLDAAKKDLAAKEKRIAELELELKSVDSGRTDLDLELAARSKSIADFGLKLDAAKKDLVAKEKRIADLDFELAKAKKAGASSDCSKYEAQIKALQNDLESRNKQIKDLKIDMEAIDLGRTDLDTELEARSTSIADFGLKLNASKKDLAAKEKQIADLEVNLAKALKANKASTKPPESTKSEQSTSSQNPDIHVRYLGEKIKLRGNVSSDIHKRVISKAIKDHGKENILDDLNTKDIASSPKWTESILTAAVSVSRDLKDASLELKDKNVVLTGIVASEQESSKVESKIRKQLASDLKIDNRLSVVGKDIKQDDLKEIKGIATVLEPVLHSNGVYTFRQIACWSQSDVEQVRESLGGFKGRIEREEWIRQARELHIKHYNEEPKCYGKSGAGSSSSSTKSSSSKSSRKASSAAGPDDLTRIEGIGPKMNQALLADGIRTFADLEAASIDRLTNAINKAGMSFSPSLKNWSKQAKYLVDGDEEGFLKYTDYLIAGVDPSDVSSASSTSGSSASLSSSKTSDLSGRGSSTSGRDDLTRIEGIGPKMNQALLADGITTFVELEAASIDRLTNAINKAGMSFSPSLKNWSKQAKYLVDGDEEGFLKYTDYLIAGVDPSDIS